MIFIIVRFLLIQINLGLLAKFFWLKFRKIIYCILGFLRLVRLCHVNMFDWLGRTWDDKVLDIELFFRHIWRIISRGQEVNGHPGNIF